jgi:hypothetical protein
MDWTGRYRMCHGLEANLLRGCKQYAGLDRWVATKIHSDAICDRLHEARVTPADLLNQRLSRITMSRITLPRIDASYNWTCSAFFCDHFKG